MRTESYFVIDGKLTIFKTPGARLLYGIDLAAWLAIAGTQLQTVTGSARGVTLDGAAFIDGTAVCAWVEGLDPDEGAENSVTFAFECADGKSRDFRKIYFKPRPG